MRYLIRLFPFIIFGFLIGLIIFPLLPPGFILTMDLPPSDKQFISPVTSTDFFLSVIFYFFHLIIPNYIIQKLILTIALTLSFWGMYRLVPVERNVSKLFAAIFYMINPYIYARLVSGQWLLVLGYSLLPWIISSVIQFFKNSSIRNILILSLLFSLMVNISLHFFALAVAFFLIYAVVLLIGSFPDFKRGVVGCLKLLGFILLFNLNWIIGNLVQGSTLWKTFSTIGPQDLSAFQSVADPTYGLIFNLLGGFGFWAEAYNYYISPKNLFPFWPAVTIVLVGLSLFGFYLSIKKNKSNVLAVTLGIFFLISLNLAAGLALPNITSVILYLYEKLLILRGFREPQKLIAIIMFCFAYFGSIGLERLEEIVQGKRRFISVVFIILPLIYTLPIFFGFWGQLKPVFYPSSWEKVNQVLKEDKSDFLTLFFPWHQYMRFKFANDRVVSNPALYYFAKPVISSQNYETEYLYSHDTRLESLHVEGLLSIEKEGVNLLGDTVEGNLPWGESLSPINVKYIILAKDDDWVRYKFLDKQPDLTKVYEDDDLVFYQNVKWEAKDKQLEEINFDEPLAPLE